MKNNFGCHASPVITQFLIILAIVMRNPLPYLQYIWKKKHETFHLISLLRFLKGGGVHALATCVQAAPFNESYKRKMSKNINACLRLLRSKQLHTYSNRLRALFKTCRHWIRIISSEQTLTNQGHGFSSDVWMAFNSRKCQAFENWSRRYVTKSFNIGIEL